jgi:hypothetical protein
MTDRSSFDIVNTLSSLEGKAEHKLEYIKMMVAMVQEDIRNVSLYVTLGLGLMAFTLSQVGLDKILALAIWARILLFFGILTAALASYCFFLYIRALHITRMKMTRCLVSLDVIRTRELWAGDAGVWRQHGKKYKIGQAFIVFSIACFTIVLFYMLVFVASADISAK